VPDVRVGTTAGTGSGFYHSEYGELKGPRICPAQLHTAKSRLPLSVGNIPQTWWICLHTDFKGFRVPDVRVGTTAGTGSGFYHSEYVVKDPPTW
jgi:hypothetical protein